MNPNYIKVKSGLVKIFLLAAFWAIAGAIFSINDYLSVAHFAKDIGLSKNLNYNFFRNLFTSSIIASFGGILIGATEVFYFQKRFRQESFGRALFIKTLFYSAGLIILIFIGSIMYHSLLAGRNIIDPLVASGVRNHMFSLLFWGQILTWSAVIFITQFVLIVSDKFGTGVLKQFLLGYYYKPKNEKRIFMFLDLKSSTTIAEKLKHEKYFEFLNQFFSDVTDPIIYSKGEIYQYVGDEVTVSWQLKNGLEKNNCIKCFFDIDKQIDSRKKFYLNDFGIIPEYKAGLHVGEVITGEVGIVKKEIVFSGDILNTTSRIQAECNKNNTRILISGDLYNLLPDKSGLKFVDLNEIKLRGKDESIRLFSIQN